MRIAYIAAGAGGMYCGMCLHDNTLAAALLEQGEEVLLIPTYTPIRTDEVDVSQPRVFFGGINVYLEQKLPVFRRLPAWLTGVLDQRWLLRLATKRAGSVDPARLGDLTVSMLQGEKGHQRRELDQLTEWLARDVRPDVVHLSNCMLLGMARQFRRRLGVPVVCSLSGEDVFLERLVPPYYEAARRLMIESTGEVDRYVALNHYYADYVARFLEVDRERIDVIPHGLKLQGHGRRRESPDGGPLTIGYFNRICPDKGFHLLVEAFSRLANDKSLPPLRLRAAGYLADADRRYFRKVVKELERAGLGDRFHYFGEPDRAGKIAFLQSLDIAAMPTVYRESKGLSVLETMANGVPIVVPEHGAFPELIEDTQAGLLCKPENAGSLAEAMKMLVRDADLRRELGNNGYEAVRDRYHDRLMAERTRGLYYRTLGGKAARPHSAKTAVSSSSGSGDG